jgi:hypothetical protein
MEQEAITQFGARFWDELVEPADGRSRDTNDGSQHETARENTLSEVLFEQLDYLIQFADQERDRLDRVRAILMETFN